MSRVSSSSIPTTGVGGSFIAVICAPAPATEIMIAQKSLASISVARVADITHVISRVLTPVNHVWTLVIGFANIKVVARWCAERAKAAQDLEKALEDVKLVRPPVEEKKAAEEPAYQRKQAIPSNEPFPVTSQKFSKKCHHLEQVPQSVKDPWTKATRRLIAYYDEASELARTNSAHVEAYEAAVATLSQEYLAELGHSDDLKGSISPEEMALGLARRRCGLPTLPKADVRFRVEACWLTFGIRFQLASLAQKAAEIFVKADVPTKVRSLWADMIEDILCSVERDALFTIDVARNSHSNRQIVRTVLFLIEAQYQVINHRVHRYLNPTRLGSLKDEARKAYAEAKAAVAKYGGQFREAMDTTTRPTDQQWLEDNYTLPADSNFEKWNTLLTQLEQGSFKNQVTSAQNSQTVKALMDKSFGTIPKLAVTTLVKRRHWETEGMRARLELVPN
ncbi:hypothetical protein FS837_006067 [Tulasnella sp. UAMH 9824]|nr:hypothetical protein FS837_006067 [Tulasnella sp. UAMH 9824]